MKINELKPGTFVIGFDDVIYEIIRPRIDIGEIIVINLETGCLMRVINPEETEVKDMIPNAYENIVKALKKENKND